MYWQVSLEHDSSLMCSAYSLDTNLSLPCMYLYDNNKYVAIVTLHLIDNQFTIQWDQVHNDDHVSDGPFTFQLTLFRDGSINFAYRQVRAQPALFIRLSICDRYPRPQTTPSFSTLHKEKWEGVVHVDNIM